MARIDARNDIDRPLNGEIRVLDEGGVAIADGQLLAVTGARGPQIKVRLADADSATLRDTVLLIASGNITASDIGGAHTWRVLRNVNTLGATVGDPVYLSVTAGGWSLSPAAVAVQVGVVLAVSATVGTVMLAPAALRVSSASLLGEALIDDRMLRADGTAHIQNTLWTVADTTGAMSIGVSTSITATGAAVDLTVTAGRNLSLVAALGTWTAEASAGNMALSAVGATSDFTVTAGRAVSLTAVTDLALAAEDIQIDANNNIGIGAGGAVSVEAAAHILLHATDELRLWGVAGWVINNGVTYTLAEVNRFFTIADVTPALNTILIGDGAAWVGATLPANALTLGAPEYASSAGTLDIAAGEITLTFTVVQDSAEVTYSAGEFIIVTAGLWKIEWSVAVSLDTSGSGDVWLTDDIVLQGTDAETVGTRRKHRVLNDVGSSDGPCAAFALLQLDVGDTVRLRAHRVTGADICEAQHRTIMLQRIG